jgi:hypothetical protein
MSKSSITTEKKLPPIHPGRILLEDPADTAARLGRYFGTSAQLMATPPAVFQYVPLSAARPCRREFSTLL